MKAWNFVQRYITGYFKFLDIGSSQIWRLVTFTAILTKKKRFFMSLPYLVSN